MLKWLFCNKDDEPHKIVECITATITEMSSSLISLIRNQDLKKCDKLLQVTQTEGDKPRPS